MLEAELKKVETTSSNRTFMELKSVYSSEYWMSLLCSNRTFMELKYGTLLLHLLLIGCSNRTFM